MWTPYIIADTAAVFLNIWLIKLSRKNCVKVEGDLLTFVHYLFELAHDLKWTIQHVAFGLNTSRVML